MSSINIPTSQKVHIDFELADTKDRIFAALIDLVVVGLSLVSLIMAANYLKLNFIVNAMSPDIWLLVSIFYHLLMELICNGQTVGKMAIGIRTVNVSGKNATLTDHFMRAVFRLVEVYMSFGLLGTVMTIVTKMNQRIGDIAANTVQIRTRSSLQFRIDDITNIESLENYEVLYPDVTKLTEADMLLVKEALSRNVKYTNDAHRGAIDQLANKMGAALGIQIPEGRRTDFLKNVLRDYIVLTR